MGVKTHNDENIATKYTFRRKAGRNIIERKPIFSPDGESVIIIVENIVRVYNIQTGDCTRILETETPINELIAIHFPENENYNLFGCSDTGCVTAWTWENGAVLREVNLHVPKGKKVQTFHLLDNSECLVTSAVATQKRLHMGIYSIKTGELLYQFKDHNVFHFKDMIKVAIGRYNGDQFAAIVNGSPFLFIHNINQPHIKQIITNTNKIRILSVCVHQRDNAIAITDALGQAAVYRGNFWNENNVGKETLHWHTLPATAACFSLQGSYLYTGGMEKVLVKWTIGNLANKAYEKVFIPRLPGMIRHIATNNTYVAIVLTNNSIVIANAQMRVVSTILECGGLSPAARALNTPLVYHHRLDGLLMGGRTGHLQLYSTSTDKVLYNIDITGLNNIPPERHNLFPFETEITCAAVSGNGSWLVTSEYRNDGITYPEERLKFWALEPKSACPFKLNTCVNLSHGGCNVVSIVINTRGELCVTAGADQKFRVWKREMNKLPLHKGKKQSVSSWSCLTACYYSSGIAQFLSHDILNKYKNDVLPPAKGQPISYMRDYMNANDVVKKLMNIHKEHGLLNKVSVNPGIKRDDENDMAGVAISHDGSLIAAWFGCKLTLWDTHLCNLRTTLSHPALRPKGINVHFGNRDAAHYLVCTTENCVAVWSLLSLTIKWLVNIKTTCLAADPNSSKMAIVTTNNDVYVFTPHNSTPILTLKRVVDPATGVFKQCTFGASSGDHVRLYVMRNDSEIYCLEPEKSEEGRLEIISRRNLPASNFSALLAEQQLSEVQPASAGAVRELDTDALSNSALNQFLSAAPHMVPPVSLLCTSFLQHISGHKTVEDTEETQDDIMEVDGSSSEDEGTNSQLNGPYAPKAAQLWTPNYEKIKEKRLQKILLEPLLDLHATESIFGV